MYKKHEKLINLSILILVFVLLGTLSYSAPQAEPMYIDSPEVATAINYSATSPLSFDKYAYQLTRLVINGVKHISFLAFSLLSILFSIQLIIDISNAYATGKFEEIFKMLYSRIITFGIYLSVLGMIFNGRIFKMATSTAYKLVELLSGTSGVEKIDNIWNLKNLLTDSLFRVMNELVFFGYPSTIINSFLTAIFLVILILIINILFFMIMVDIFKLVIGFTLCLNLSSIFMPLGIFKASNQVYSVSKVLSLLINFIFKIVSINVFAIVGIKAIKESGILEKVISTAADTSITSFIIGDFMTLVLLIFIVTTTILKIDVSF